MPDGSFLRKTMIHPPQRIEADGSVLPQETKGELDARNRWLTPVILNTQEPEIRRITVRSQPGQIVLETLSQKKKNLHKKGLVEWLK
jgi:hypothetical protein